MSIGRGRLPCLYQNREYLYKTHKTVALQRVKLLFFCA